MNDQIKRYIDPIKNFWRALTKKKKIIILSSLGGVILLSVIIGIVLNQQPYVVLYPGLDQTEAVDVMNELKDRDVSYKEDNGTIYVPKDKENALRMDLSNEGYPKTAPNYDFFTSNVNVMSTDYEKKTIERYQLNQRLEAVIKTLDCIKNANVTISIPESSSYAWDTDAAKPSASVTVQLATGKTLNASQVGGIKQLVAKSVPNLSTDDVAVIDTATGNELSAASDNKTAVDISEFKLQIENEYEQDIEKSVLKVLTPIFGEGNVQVTAKSIMDVDKKVKEALSYTPSTDNKGVISKSTENSEKETGGDAAGGAVGTETNADTTTYTGVTTDGNTIYTKDEKTYEYLVSQVKEQIQSDAATVQDMTISVAVNKEAMDDAQKQEISKLIAYAAAIQPEKVAVYNSAFINSNAVDTGAQPAGQDVNRLVLFAGAAVLNLLFILLIVFIIISKQRKKKLLALLEAPVVEEQPVEQTGENAAVAKALSAEEEAAEKARRELEAIHAAQQSREQGIRKELQDFSSQNPEIAAQLIKSWLRGEDSDG